MIYLRQIAFHVQILIEILIKIVSKDNKNNFLDARMVILIQGQLIVKFALLNAKHVKELLQTALNALVEIDNFLMDVGIFLN